MKPMLPVSFLLVLGAAGVALVWWVGSSQQTVPRDLRNAGSEADAPSRADQAGVSAESGVEPAPVPPRGTGLEFRTVEAADDRSRSSGGREIPRVVWPVRSAARNARRAGAVGSGELAVAEEVAFHALRFVGIDPEAEKIWLRAINDPRMPAGTRSDLIEDLNEQGYLDNSRPTKEDLPLILARLELIERLAPFAADEVNAAAFEEAYKDLLNMYIRLGGNPR